MLDALKTDMRGSLRVLMARPGFALAVIATVALGIGANSAIFSVINGLLLRPLPYPNSSRLVYIYNVYPKMNQEPSGMTVPDYIDRRDQADVLTDSALYYDRSFNLAGSGVPQNLAGIVATPSLFTTLQVTAALGRTFTAEESDVGQEHVAVLSDGLWRNQFNADPAIVGHDIRLNSENYRVVGVMPQTFGFPNRDVQVWTAFAFTEKQMSDSMRGFDFARSIGRLKPGATIEQLNAQFDLIVQRNVGRFARIGSSGTLSYKTFIGNSGFTGRSKSLHDQQVGDVTSLLWLLQAAVLTVLLIACANVANLMLLHFSSRHRELALRCALGAGRGRIAQQLLVESALLAASGGIAGIGVAQACIHLIHALGLDGSVRGFDIGIDGSVLAFTLLATLLATLVFGLVPVVSLAREQPSDVLKEGARGGLGSRRTSMTRNGLVIAQVTLATVLLIGAGLLIHSFALAQQQSPGFDSNHVLSAAVHLPPNRYKNSADAEPFLERLMAEVRALPGVKSAGVVGSMLFTDDESSTPFYVEGHDVEGAEPASLGYIQTVDVGFFRTLQIPLLQGRGFLPSDDANAARVVIVDELLARKYFPEGNTVGHRISTRNLNDKRVWQTIVGIVATVKRNHLDASPEIGTFYFHFRQSPTRLFTLVMKTDLATADLIGPLRAAMRRIDPEQPLFDIKTMSERIDASLDGRRAPMLLLMLFAGVALALAAVGIYGVLAYGVAQRRGEIGVRMSLGACAGDIHRLVMLDGGRLVAIGLTLGLVIALSLAQFMQTQLFGIDVTDPLALGIALATIVAAAFCACWIPARRAASTDPIVALRHD